MLSSGPSIQDGHFGAAFCQSQCNTAPDSPRGAGDQGEFSVKLFRVDRHPIIPFSSGVRRSSNLRLNSVGISAASRLRRIAPADYLLETTSETLDCHSSHSEFDGVFPHFHSHFSRLNDSGPATCLACVGCSSSRPRRQLGPIENPSGMGPNQIYCYQCRSYGVPTANTVPAPENVKG